MNGFITVDYCSILKGDSILNRNGLIRERLYEYGLAQIRTNKVGTNVLFQGPATRFPQKHLGRPKCSGLVQSGLAEQFQMIKGDQVCRIRNFSTQSAPGTKLISPSF